MPAFAITMAGLLVGFEYFVQSKLGAAGVVGLTLLVIGVKAKNVTLSCIGATVLALLVPQMTGGS